MINKAKENISLDSEIEELFNLESMRTDQRPTAAYNFMISQMQYHGSIIE